VVAEQPPAHEAPDVLATMLRQALVEEVASLEQMSMKTILSRREARFMHVHGLRGRLQLFMRPAADSGAAPARQA